ncbi:MAG: hypothetical protein M1829_002711 [Trizodia sp. TS-e1964]|nr:MAG: hypothetical protein M1829_002711 [Trizodia sp. TS-e1964]
MTSRKRKPTAKASEAPKASQNKRGSKPASVQKPPASRAAGSQAPKQGPIAQNIEPAINLLEQAPRIRGSISPFINLTPEPEPMPATEPALAPALKPTQAPEPSMPVILMLETTFKLNQITNDSMVLNSINDFSFSRHKIEQHKRVAHLAGGAGYSHYLEGIVALISHSKAQKEPKLVDLSIKKEAWNEVKQFTAHFHGEKKPDIEIQLKIHNKRRRQSARALLASVDILSDPLAIEEQRSQRVTKCVQEGLDAAAAI